jgi:hypothetical protein
MKALRLAMGAAVIVLATVAAGSNAFAQRCSKGYGLLSTGLRQDAT